MAPLYFRSAVSRDITQKTADWRGGECGICGVAVASDGFDWLHPWGDQV
jgi:hypothetical protein